MPLWLGYIVPYVVAIATIKLSRSDSAEPAAAWQKPGQRWVEPLENGERGRDFCIALARRLAQLDLVAVATPPPFVPPCARPLSPMSRAQAAAAGEEAALAANSHDDAE